MDKTPPQRGEPLAVTHPPPSSIPEKFNKELNQTADAYHEAGHCVAFDTQRRKSLRHNDAGGGNRTHMGFLPRDFKSLASTVPPPRPSY